MTHARRARKGKQLGIDNAPENLAGDVVGVEHVSKPRKVAAKKKAAKKKPAGKRSL